MMVSYVDKEIKMKRANLTLFLALAAILFINPKAYALSNWIDDKDFEFSIPTFSLFCSLSYMIKNGERQDKSGPVVKWRVHKKEDKYWLSVPVKDTKNPNNKIVVHYRIIKFSEWDIGIYFTALYHHMINNGKRYIQSGSTVLEYSSGSSALTTTRSDILGTTQFNHKCSKPQDIQRK